MVAVEISVVKDKHVRMGNVSVKHSIPRRQSPVRAKRFCLISTHRTADNVAMPVILEDIGIKDAVSVHPMIPSVFVTEHS